MDTVESEYCVVQDSDMYRLPRLLANYPNLVLVRDMFGGFFPLIKIVHGPFVLRREDGVWVINVTRVCDGKTGCFRIIKYKGEDVLQWKASLRDPWRFDSNWIPPYQLYIPNKIIVPRSC